MLISVKDKNRDIRSGVTDVSGLGKSDINKTLLVRMKYLFQHPFLVVTHNVIVVPEESVRFQCLGAYISWVIIGVNTEYRKFATFN